jgi:hypothetical protein
MRSEVFVYLDIYLDMYLVHIEIYDYGVFIQGVRFPDELGVVVIVSS